MQLSPVLHLNDGADMPVVGLGCYKALGDDVYHAIRWAVEAGYRHIDTAMRYENEEDVGRAIRECGVPRESLFLVDKLWPSRFAEPEKNIEQTLRALKADYLDAYLLHWPGADESLRLRAWETMLRYQQKGYIRSVGVSNFMIPHLEQLIAASGVVPAVNQIQLHPWYQQRELCDDCRKKGIAVTAWGPIFRGHLNEVPLMTELAEKYQKTPAQITLRWHLQKGFAVIPKSTKEIRIWENIDLFTFSLAAADMERIDALDCGKGIGGNDPYTYDGDNY